MRRSGGDRSLQPLDLAKLPNGQCHQVGRAEIERAGSIEIEASPNWFKREALMNFSDQRIWWIVGAVVVVVIIMGIFLWLVDMLLLSVVKALTGQGG